jgi:serine/threonine protein kinase
MTTRPEIILQNTATVFKIDKDFRWNFAPSYNPKIMLTKLGEIGHGGFGTVYQFYYRELMLPMAGKIFNLPDIDEETTTQIKNEVETMKSVSSEFIAICYGLVPYDNSLMILMEYFNLGSLRDILDHSFIFNEYQIAVIIKDVLKGLEILHSSKIMHRDIKAVYILINSNGKICISDFGLSIPMKDENLGVSTSVGTTL